MKENEDSGKCPVCGKDVLLKDGVLIGVQIGVQINGAGKADSPGGLQLCCNKQCGAAYLLAMALILHRDVIGVKR